MNKEERKTKLQEIQTFEPEAANALKLPYQGETVAFNVYKIPIDFLVFNKKNGRIASLVKSYVKEHQPIDVETPEGSKLIARFLYEAHKDRNDTTRTNIIENGQLNFGIVTSDGVIVDGNRRVTLLLSISQDKDLPQSVRDRSKYFLAAILPEQFGDKEILRLETQYQMAADDKVDYNPIEKYLHAFDMELAGFTVDEIKTYMGFKNRKEAMQAIEMVKLIDEYLVTFDYEGIYTQIPKGAEDKFLKLNDAIKRIKEGGISWIPTTGKDEVITNLKAICFDFIRLGEHNQEEYRSIMQGNSFLANEGIWNGFVENYFNKIDAIDEEKSTEEYLEKSNSDEDSSRLLRKRDYEWKESVNQIISDTFSEYKTSLDNTRDKDEPLKLIKKAVNAVKSINLDVLKDASNKGQVLEYMEELKDLLDDIQKEIK